MVKQSALIGMELDNRTHTIESNLLRLMNQALFRPDCFLDNKTKETHVEDYGTYPNFLLGSLINLPQIYRALSLNIKNVLVSRESAISHRRLNLGDSVCVRTYLKDIYEQQATSNPIGFVMLESFGEVKTDLAFYAERVLLVRGGFTRGRP